MLTFIIIGALLGALIGAGISAMRHAKKQTKITREWIEEHKKEAEQLKAQLQGFTDNIKIVSTEFSGALLDNQ